MVVDFEHHYIPAELGRRMGLDPTRKEAVRTRDASVHSQLFDLEAQLPGHDDPVPAQGRVVRQAGPGQFGVQFLRLGDEARQRIESFVQGNAAA